MFELVLQSMYFFFFFEQLSVFHGIRFECVLLAIKICFSQTQQNHSQWKRSKR